MDSNINNSKISVKKKENVEDILSFLLWKVYIAYSVGITIKLDTIDKLMTISDFKLFITDCNICITNKNISHVFNSFSSNNNNNSNINNNKNYNNNASNNNTNNYNKSYYITDSYNTTDNYNTFSE